MISPPLLTPRERDCLPLLVSGKTRHEMARELDVSVETIKKHVRSMLKKYDAANIRDALPAMRLHQEYYFDTTANFEVFCNLAKFSAVIDTEKRSAYADFAPLYSDQPGCFVSAFYGGDRCFPADQCRN